MTQPTRRILITGSIILFVVINVVALRWSTAYFLSPRNTTLMRYGGKMPGLKGQSLLGNKPVEISAARTNLVLYFSATRQPGLSIELVKYAEILSQHYGKQGFGVSAIVQPGVDELKTLVQHSLLTYDLIVDQDRQIAEKLGLAANENGVFLFNRQGVCQFATRGPVSARDLQQLVALEFLGVDPYTNPTSSPKSIEQGKKLQSWSILDVRSWQQTSLDKVNSGAAKTFIVFTAECSVCSLPGYLEEFSKFEQAQLRQPGVANSSVLVFDYNFSITDVLEQLTSHNINAPAYIANEQLPAVPDMAQANSLKDITVVALRTDTGGTVLEVSPLKSMIAESKKANVANVKAGVEPALNEPRYEEIFTEIAFTAYDVAAYHEKYVLSDFKGNRILILNDKIQVEKSLGGIGSGPGRLFRPGSVDVSDDGTIYVEDGGNERVVKFSIAGQFLGELPLNNYEGLAVGPGNELYLGQPEAGHLITVYDSSGKKLRSFGGLKKFSEVNGAESVDKDEPFKFAINRVRLATDRAHNIYVSFTLTPLLQKYGPSGELLFESKLEGPEIERLKTSIQKRKYITSPVEGPSDGRIIALDPVIDPITGNILIPLVDGSIYVADSKGKRIDFLRPQASQPADQTFYPFVAGLGAKGEFLVNPFPPKHWYRLVLPTMTKVRAPTHVQSNGAGL